MSEQDKAAVIDLVNRMPAGATLHDIAREIEFIAGVREGFELLDRGEGVPIEEVERRCVPAGTPRGRLLSSHS